MKLMDEVAGIVAARHCKTNIVTASVDAINFHDKIRKGNGTVPTECRGLPAAAWALALCLAPTQGCLGPGTCPLATGNRKPGLCAVFCGCVPEPRTP